MSTNQETPTIPLPRGWKQHVRSSVLHVIALAQFLASDGARLITGQAIGPDGAEMAL